MNKENIIGFIKRGMNYDNSLLRKGCFAFDYLSLLAIIFGIVLGGKVLAISIAMQLVALFNHVIISILIAKQRTIKKRLLINLIFPLCAIINLLLLSIIIYINAFGVNLGMVILLFPVILTVTLVSIRTIYLLKKDDFSHKKVRSSNIILSFTCTGICSPFSGILGMRLGETLFKDANQTTAVIFLLSVMILGTCLFSISTNNIFKLYYMHKLEKMGITINRAITPGIIYLQKKDIAS